MAAPLAGHPILLVNPLATPEKLESSSSQLDGIDTSLEESIRFAACKLVQAAGALLRLPQDLVAQAIVTYTRFWVGPEGGSLKIYSAHDIALASLYLTTKVSAYPVTPRSIVNIFAYLLAAPIARGYSPDDKKPEPEAYYVSEDMYYDRRNSMMKHESVILRTLGFQLHVSLPFTLCINYLQILGILEHSASQKLTNRAFEHLNTLILSPQLVYLTHQPSVLATAAIYLSARETGVKLPEDSWWEIFDTDRENLGFLIVAMTSMEAFALQEKKQWGRAKAPLTVEEVDVEMEKRRKTNGQT